MFLIAKTRPNITFSIGGTTCLIKNLSHSYCEIIKITLQYFKKSIHQGIIYGEEKKLIVERYFDSN